MNKRSSVNKENRVGASTEPRETPPFTRNGWAKIVRLLRKPDFHDSRAENNPDVEISARSPFKKLDTSGDARCTSAWLSNVAEHEFEPGASRPPVGRRSRNPYRPAVSGPLPSRNERHWTEMIVLSDFETVGVGKIGR